MSPVTAVAIASLDVLIALLVLGFVARRAVWSAPNIGRRSTGFFLLALACFGVAIASSLVGSYIDQTDRDIRVGQMRQVPPPPDVRDTGRPWWDFPDQSPEVKRVLTTLASFNSSLFGIAVLCHIAGCLFGTVGWVRSHQGGTGCLLNLFALTILALGFLFLLFLGALVDAVSMGE